MGYFILGLSAYAFAAVLVLRWLNEFLPEGSNMDSMYEQALDILEHIQKLQPNGFISLSHEFLRYGTPLYRLKIIWSLVDPALGEERVITGETPQAVFDTWLYETRQGKYAEDKHTQEIQESASEAERKLGAIAKAQSKA